MLEKGTFGHLNRQLKREIAKMILFYAICLVIFVTGVIYFGTRNNLMTVVAAVGCLPAGKSTVSVIMYCKAGRCSKELFDAISSLGCDACALYDLYLTGYKQNFQISAAVVADKHILAFSESGDIDCRAGEEHISSILEKNSIRGFLVKIFTDRQKFMDRITSLCGPGQVPQTDEDVKHILKNISL
ncbi:MAG: hypothetical protein K5641_05025 [Lachnospiraceae bacterium]|nr:hypothetical protein [Lachnospiraceae bacterium]